MTFTTGAVRAGQALLPPPPWQACPWRALAPATHTMEAPYARISFCTFCRFLCRSSGLGARAMLW